MNSLSNILKSACQNILVSDVRRFCSLISVNSSQTHTTFIFSIFEKEAAALLERVAEAEKSDSYDPDKDPPLLHQLLSDPDMKDAETAVNAVLALFIAGGETVYFTSINHTNWMWNGQNLSYVLAYSRQKRFSRTSWMTCYSNWPS